MVSASRCAHHRLHDRGDSKDCGEGCAWPAGTRIGPAGQAHRRIPHDPWRSFNGGLPIHTGHSWRPSPDPYLPRCLLTLIYSKDAGLVRRARNPGASNCRCMRAGTSTHRFRTGDRLSSLAATPDAYHPGFRANPLRSRGEDPGGDQVTQTFPYRNLSARPSVCGGRRAGRCWISSPRSETKGPTRRLSCPASERVAYMKRLIGSGAQACHHPAAMTMQLGPSGYRRAIRHPRLIVAAVLLLLLVMALASFAFRPGTGSANIPCGCLPPPPGLHGTHSAPALVAARPAGTILPIDRAVAIHT